MKQYPSVKFTGVSDDFDMRFKTLLLDIFQKEDQFADVIARKVIAHELVSACFERGYIDDEFAASLRNMVKQETIREIFNKC